MNEDTMLLQKSFLLKDVLKEECSNTLICMQSHKSGSFEKPVQRPRSPAHAILQSLTSHYSRCPTTLGALCSGIPTAQLEMHSSFVVVFALFCFGGHAWWCSGIFSLLFSQGSLLANSGNQTGCQGSNPGRVH